MSDPQTMLAKVRQGVPQPLPREAESRRFALRSALAVACWTGLAAGFAESFCVLIKVILAQQGFVRNTPHIFWMIPASDLLIFALFGAFLWLIGRKIPGRAGWILSVGLAALGFLAVLLTVPGLLAWASLMLAMGLGVQLGPAILARSKGFGRVVRWTLPLFLAAEFALIGLLVARERSRRPELDPSIPTPPAGAPNMLLIVLDTVRFDATSLAEVGRETTPFLKSLADRGVSFQTAMAPAPWTLPSHGSMFTGRWPWELGLGPDQPLGRRYPTLAEWLGHRGYRTAGFAANTFFCSDEYGLSRGFQHYEDYPINALEVARASSIGWLAAMRVAWLGAKLEIALGRGDDARLPEDFRRKSAAAINAAALRWIDRHERERDERPFFVFLNYFDVHDPYQLPKGAPWRFGPPPTALADRRAILDWDPEIPRPHDPRDARLNRDAYDNCLAYLDGQLRLLFERLEASGTLDNTIVVVTSDHGEHFGEHVKDGLPMFGHGESVYQPVIHVPLLILAPGKLPTGVVVDESVSLRDLPATLLDLSGQAESSPLPGTSLAGLVLDPSGDDPPSLAFSEFDPFRDLPRDRPVENQVATWMRSVVDSGFAYHHWGDGREGLYRLQTDPLEKTNLLEQDGGGLFSLLTRLRSQLSLIAPAMPGARRTPLLPPQAAPGFHAPPPPRGSNEPRPPG